MCLLVLAWQSHPRYRLVLAGNRDEFHDRPAAPLGWWQDVPQVVAGRDLRAGGTWLGAARSGRFAVVTNFRELDAPAATGPSRGELVPRALTESAPIEAFLEALQGEVARYAGFNLLCGSTESLYYVSNRSGPGAQQLPAGIYGLSNHRLDTPSPRLDRVRGAFAAALREERLEPDDLFELLNDRTHTHIAGDALPGARLSGAGLPPDWERALSAPFVLHERYGTRCSTVLVVEHDGRTTLAERRFDARGAQAGASRFGFASNAYAPGGPVPSAQAASGRQPPRLDPSPE